MKNNKNLNPLNDPEVAEMLTMSPDDQLWSFLDDCVPYDGKDAVLVMMGDFDVDNKNEDGNITINGVPYCAMITDMIFEKSEEELLSMPLTKQYENTSQSRKSATDRILPNAAFLMITMT